MRHSLAAAAVLTSHHDTRAGLPPAERGQRMDNGAAEREGAGMPILALDAALLGCSAAVLIGQTVVAEQRAMERHAPATMLPSLAASVLREAGISPTALSGIGVTVGPGSFTGLRAALALAHGLGLASGAAVAGVTVPEALAAATVVPAGRNLWVALHTGRRSRVFLACGGTVRAIGLDDLPYPEGPVALAGDAAGVVAAWLAARGADVMLTDRRQVWARDVAVVASRRLSGMLPPLAAQPVYIDPPETRVSTAGSRPPPICA